MLNSLSKKKKKLPNIYISVTIDPEKEHVVERN